MKVYEESKKQSKDLRGLNKAINKKERDLELLNAIISRAVHESLNIEIVYKTALNLAITLENIDIAFIYLLNEDKTEAILQPHINDYISGAGRIPYPKGFTWKTVIEGKSRYIPDAVVVADKEGTIISINPLTEKVFGLNDSIRRRRKCRILITNTQI